MPDHQYALPPGYQIQHYRIERLLGHGGFGLTYLAFDQSLQRQVAIKELLPVDFAVREGGHDTVVPRSERDRDSMNWARQRFVEEGRMIASLHHPGILSVHQVIEQNGTGYLVTSYVAGGDFLQWLKQRGNRPNEQDLRAFTLAVLGALETIHAKGYLHRDLKPQNILMESGVRPVLIDFGNARMSTGEKTQSVTAIVTPGFAPFEQYQTNSRQGPYTDLYALGAILYLAISGRKPPDATDRVDEDPMIPAAHFTVHGFSPAFLATVDKALQRKASERWQTVSQWKTALQSGLHTPGSPEPQQRQPSRQAQRPSLRPSPAAKPLKPIPAKNPSWAKLALTRQPKSVKMAVMAGCAMFLCLGIWGAYGLFSKPSSSLASGEDAGASSNPASANIKTNTESTGRAVARVSYYNERLQIVTLEAINNRKLSTGTTLLVRRNNEMLGRIKVSMVPNTGGCTANVDAQSLRKGTIIRSGDEVVPEIE